MSSRFDAPYSFRTRAIQLSSVERSHYRRMRATPPVSEQQNVARASSSMSVAFMKRGVLLFLVAVMTLFYPAGIYAEEAEAPKPETLATSESQTPPTETPPAPAPVVAEPKAETKETTPPPPAPKPEPQSTPTPGPQKPTGPDHHTYTYNEQTGMWENDKYAWDPNTKQTKPKNPEPYSYNPDTGMWDTTQWRYDAPTGTYVPNTVSVKEPPKESSQPTPRSAQPEDHTANQAFDLFYDASISNNIASTATSGDATVSRNTTGGDALTGDALALANVFNLLQSSASFLGNGGQIATFSSDITGDVYGDLFIDPATLATLQSAGTPKEGTIALNVDANGQINNDIKLAAQTGNATIEGNTTAGNATSGSAHAMANIVNMLNSAISSGSSFLGMLNIYGNLNGDILLPPDVLNTLLASQTPPTTTLNTDTIENSELLAEFTNNQAINNAVNASAATGDATVSGNTTAGNATTGDALTNVTVLNLTGREIVGSNSLLVFVNVLGKWVGVIMDAPAGSTSAALGGGISQNKTAPVNGEATVTTNGQINNKVDVSAASGDATVTKNTTAGNATTGNATASVNLLNILNSSFSLSDWFGILFINVFGSWHGSFGVDTEAGETVASAPTDTGVGGAENGVASEKVKVFAFVPTGQGTQRLVPTTVDQEQLSAAAQQAEEVVEETEPEVLGATQPDDTPPASTWTDDSTPRGANWALPTAGFIVGSSMLGAERLVSLRQRRRLANVKA